MIEFKYLKWDVTLRWLADSETTNSEGELLYDEENDIDYIWTDSTLWGIFISQHLTIIQHIILQVQK